MKIVPPHLKLLLERTRKCRPISSTLDSFQSMFTLQRIFLQLSFFLLPPLSSGKIKFLSSAHAAYMYTPALATQEGKAYVGNGEELFCITACSQYYLRQREIVNKNQNERFRLVFESMTAYILRQLSELIFISNKQGDNVNNNLHNFIPT